MIKRNVRLCQLDSRAKLFQMKFDPKTYLQFRPRYPIALTELWRNWLRLSAGVVPVFRAADIGAGTGFSTQAIATLARQITVVEPDREMLDQARLVLEPSEVRFDFVRAPGGRAGLEAGAFDFVQLASSFHWMDQAQVVSEVVRALRRPGLVGLCEYSFPQSSEFPELQEWITEKFLGEWQTAELKNRLPFAELADAFGERGRAAGWHSAHPERFGPIQVPMLHELGWSEMVGLVFSQSRFLRRLDAMTLTEGDRFRDEVRTRIFSLMGERRASFDFHLQAIGYWYR